MEISEKNYGNIDLCEINGEPKEREAKNCGGGDFSGPSKAVIWQRGDREVAGISSEW